MDSPMATEYGKLTMVKDSKEYGKMDAINSHLEIYFRKF